MPQIKPDNLLRMSLPDPPPLDPGALHVQTDQVDSFRDHLQRARTDSTESSPDPPAGANEVAAADPPVTADPPAEDRHGDPEETDGVAPGEETLGDDSADEAAEADSPQPDQPDADNGDTEQDKTDAPTAEAPAEPKIELVTGSEGAKPAETAAAAAETGKTKAENAVETDLPETDQTEKSQIKVKVVDANRGKEKSGGDELPEKTSAGMENTLLQDASNDGEAGEEDLAEDRQRPETKPTSSAGEELPEKAPTEEKTRAPQPTAESSRKVRPANTEEIEQAIEQATEQATEQGKESDTVESPEQKPAAATVGHRDDAQQRSKATVDTEAEKPTLDTAGTRSPDVQTDSKEPAAPVAEARPEGVNADSKPAVEAQGDVPSNAVPRTASNQPGQNAALEQPQDAAEPGQVDRARFVQRVARAFQAVGSRNGSVRLRLHPPELGSLRLDITVRNGMMSARVEAETATARNLLLDNLPALRDRLAQQDIKVEQFNVDLTDRSPSGLPDRTADHAGGQDPDRGDDAPSSNQEMEEAPEASSAANPRRPGEGTQLNVVV